MGKTSAAVIARRDALIAQSSAAPELTSLTGRATVQPRFAAYSRMARICNGRVC